MDAALNTQWVYLANGFTGVVAFFWQHRHLMCVPWKLQKNCSGGRQGNTGQMSSLQKVTGFKYGKYCWMCAEITPCTGYVLFWHRINQHKIPSQLTTLPKFAYFIWTQLNTWANFPTARGPVQLAVHCRENIIDRDSPVLWSTAGGSSSPGEQSCESVCDCSSWGS